MNNLKLLSDFNSIFTDKSSDEIKKILLQFLNSYEFQRSLNIDQISAFLNSINTPTIKLRDNQKKKVINLENEVLKKKKEKRSRKYMTLVEYKSDILSFRKQGLSFNNIAKALIAKHSIQKKLQPSRQNIFNFLKEQLD